MSIRGLNPVVPRALRLLFCAALLLALAPAGQAQGPTPLFSDIGAGLAPVYIASAVWGDYDADGDLDILLAGTMSVESEWVDVMAVYRNDGGTFTDIGAGLPGLRWPSLAWGDYDSDGDLDILLAGSTTSSAITRVYRNDEGTFADANAGLPGVAGGSLAWGDYDNDGDLDILLTGTAMARIYRNDGDGAFALVDAELQGVMWSSAAWGDYDADGDLDILLAGALDSSNDVTKVYRNDGSGAFADINAGLPGVHDAPLAWGDYDNDGDLDILLTGRDSSTGLDIARVYRNDGGDTFADIDAGLPGCQDGSAAWGDYDNDGDLDILLGGMRTGGEFTALFRNDGSGTFTQVDSGLPDQSQFLPAWGDYDNDGDLDVLIASAVYRNDGLTGNTLPAAPAGLSAAMAGDVLVLSWSPASDAETPAAGLNYNLRVGTTPGGADVVSPMADPASGWRRLSQPGNAGPGTSAWLQGLPPGTYYWSVQAVDTAFAGGPFAEEQSFTVPAGHGIPLAVGWNLISLPVVPADPDPAAVFGSIDGSYDAVYAYTAVDEGDPWKQYIPGAPSGNDLTAVDASMGIWIHTASPVELSLTGSTSLPSTIALKSGWNLVGYPSDAQTSVATALASIAGTYDLVYAYDAADAADPWEKYDEAMPAALDSLTQMAPGNGYWLHVTADCEWSVP